MRYDSTCLFSIQQIQFDQPRLRALVSAAETYPDHRDILKSYRRTRAAVRLLIDRECERVFTQWPCRNGSILPTATFTSTWKADALEPEPFGEVPGVGFDQRYLERMSWRHFLWIQNPNRARPRPKHFRASGVAFPCSIWPRQTVPNETVLRLAGFTTKQEVSAFQSDFRSLSDLYDYYLLLRSNVIEVLGRIRLAPPDLVAKVHQDCWTVGTPEQTAVKPLVSRKRNARRITTTDESTSEEASQEPMQVPPAFFDG